MEQTIPFLWERTWAEVDIEAIRHNFEIIRGALPPSVKLCCVVKANAYGHGASKIAPLYEQWGADWFAVSNIEEALQLRRYGITRPVLILGYTHPSCADLLAAENLSQCVYSAPYGRMLSAAAAEHGVTVNIHIKLDTGMGRLGFQCPGTGEDSVAGAAAVCRLPALRPEGVFTHFATADETDLTKTRAQAERFDAFCEMLKARGVEISIRHLNNSAGLMNFPSHYEMVRSGIVTYGLYPSDEVEPALLPLEPALQWLSRVTHVKTLPAGREISYGGTYVTTRETVVATIPVGYADGYRRSLSGRFYVLIHGKKAPILGRVCMDQLMVDVTDIPDVKLDDTVTLVGRDGDEEITVEAIAAAADSFNYEFICGISRRVPRVYCRDGKQVRSVHYLLDT